GPPQTEPVSAPGNVELLTADAVAADDAVGRSLEVDAEEDVLEGVVLDDGPGGERPDGGILLIEIDAGVADGEPAEGDIGRCDLDDVASAAAVDDGARLADQRDRTVDPELLAVDAGGNLDRGAICRG